MKINYDDPKWTAYVLGELDEQESAEITRLLESSPEARAFVEDLRFASTMIKDELTQPASPALRPEQRAAVRAAAGEGKRRWFVLQPALWAAGLAGAGLIFVLIQAPSLLRTRQEIPDVVMPQVQEPGRVGSPSGQNATTPDPAVSAEFSGSASTEPAGSPPALDKRESVADSNSSLKSAEGQSAAGNAPALIVGGVLPQQYDAAAPPPPFPSSAPGSGGAVVGGIYRRPLESVDRFAVTSPTLPDRRPRNGQPGFNTEAYDRITDNSFIRVTDNPLATFSIDVDTASYANVRRFLMQNQLPPKDAVRIEELVNYFTYDYPQPTGQHPIGAQMEIASAPWNPRHRLVRIGIKGKEMESGRRPSSDLVFLIDVSGSMESAEKLPLLKAAMKLLVDKLTENDRVSIVVYAGASGMALPPTTGDKKEVILNAIDNLRANGSTNGAAGIQLAYELAVSNFIRGGVNRVVLATDGDFNVGVTSQGDLIRLIEDKARSGVFLSVLGFGMGNLKDSTLEKLADSGNGNYAYIDSINEARKVLVEEMGGTLVTIAKDVKIQVEFNPTRVNAYRLIGYENRILRNEDFNNDLKDAGDMGSGHTVTALFEVVPAGVDAPIPSVDPLKYQPAVPAPAARVPSGQETLNLKVRYKDPEGTESRLLEVPLVDRAAAFANASQDFRFAASVAAFGMILRESPFKGSASLDAVLDLARGSKGADRSGYREEFIGLVRRARALGDLK